MNSPAIFLDRDGTLNREVHYLADPERFEWIPGSPAALQRFQAAGFALVVVTNQSGIAQGLLDEATLSAIHARMEAELAEKGVRLAGIYHCPHHPRLGSPPLQTECTCRKPGTGLFERALAELPIQLAGSWVIGDSLRDLEAGRKLGIPGVLVRTGKGAQQARDIPSDWQSDVHVADDLAAACDWILAHSASRD